MGDPFVAELLDSGSTAYGAKAATLLMERDPTCADDFGPSAFTLWRDELARIVHELATAVRMGAPSLFVSSAAWRRDGFAAREGNLSQLRHALESLRQTLDEELPARGRELAGRYIEQGVDALHETVAPKDLSLDAESEFDGLAMRFLRTVLEGERRAAITLVLDAVDQGLDISNAYTRVLIPALTEVGRLWHRNELSVAEEHFATDSARAAMTLLAHRAPRAPERGLTVVAASVSGNPHDIAVGALADFFEMDGWRAVCLGGDVPDNELVRASSYFNADLIAISAAIPSQLTAVESAIRAVVAEAGDDRPRVIVGGGAFRAAPDLWRRIGADGHAPSIDEAPAVGLSLVEGG